MDYSLTDTDITKLTDGDVPVMTYSDVIDNGLVKTLFESPSKCIIMLVRQNPNYGHWVCIFLKAHGSEAGIHVYDSYGNVPDSKKWKQNISESLLKELHQDEPYLLQELYDSGFNIFYNEYPHQDTDRHIATCGRHSVCRSCFTDLDTDEYNDLINGRTPMTPPELQGMTPDEIVFHMTQNLL